MEKNNDFIFKELKELSLNSYSPYSNFKVSCIIYLKNQNKVVGVNVENAAYNPVICAERCALPQLYAQGYNRNDIDVFALYTDSKQIGTPCGTCRQTMIELLNSDQVIDIFNAYGYCMSITVAELLPNYFSDSDLN